MDIHQLSPRFDIHALMSNHVDIIYELCRENKIFYQYHAPFVTRESILQDMKLLPPGKTSDDKFYFGFFEQDTLVAVMDLVLGYPTDDVAYIGFFMMNKSWQGRGIASEIIDDCASYLGSIGFHSIQLSVDKGNPQSNAFWTKKRFIPCRETDKVTVMELKL